MGSLQDRFAEGEGGTESSACGPSSYGLIAIKELGTVVLNRYTDESDRL